jgi:hypothetical protein
LSEPRLLVLDIETGPSDGWFFGPLFNINMSLEHLKSPSRVLAVGRKWLGEKQVRYDDVFPITDRDQRLAMLAQVHGEMSSADAIVTFNGNRFDLPKLTGEFAVEGLPPVPPIASIDVRNTTSRMGFTSGKLQHVAMMLGCTPKRKNDGFELWAEYMNESEYARREMRLYCKQDVNTLEEVFIKVRPFTRSHLWLGGDKAHCPVCGTPHDGKPSGRYRRTPCFKIELMSCKSKTCGAWWDGTRRKAA